MVIATVIFTVMVPTGGGIESFRLNGPESPFEQEEESQGKVGEGLVSDPRRPRMRGAHKRTHMAGHGSVRARFTPAPSVRCVDGHRLQNGLCAPLTC